MQRFLYVNNVVTMLKRRRVFAGLAQVIYTCPFSRNIWLSFDIVWKFTDSIAMILLVFVHLFKIKTSEEYLRGKSETVFCEQNKSSESLLVF